MIKQGYLSRTGLIVGLVLLFAITSAIAAIQVEVDGSPLSLDVAPALVNGRTMVPLRGIFEALGAQVNWDSSTRTITATKGDTDVQLGIGETRASVNGKVVILDTPAMIRNGATMVPLRFVSEALGAEVKWFEATQTVTITTANETTQLPMPPTTGGTTQAAIVPSGTVIPVSLDRELSSKVNRVGDSVSVTVRSAYNGDAEFPQGTKFRGIVSEAQQASGDEPGMLNVAFREVLLPDGSRINTDGSLVSLDEKMVKQTADGRLVVRSTSSNNQWKFIGIGAVGGFILGKLTKHTLEGTLLGAAAGYLYSENDKKNNKPGDVVVAAGTEFGIQLNRQVAFNRSQAFRDARENYLNSRDYSTTTPSSSIMVNSNGKQIAFANAQPINDSGVILVPLAPVMDQSQITYKYDPQSKNISLNTAQGPLQMNIENSYAVLNGEREELEAPAQVRNGVVYVPLNFLALATGLRVVWVADTNTVNMYRN